MISERASRESKDLGTAKLLVCDDSNLQGIWEAILLRPLWSHERSLSQNIWRSNLIPINRPHKVMRHVLWTCCLWFINVLKRHFPPVSIISGQVSMFCLIVGILKWPITTGWWKPALPSPLPRWLLTTTLLAAYTLRPVICSLKCTWQVETSRKISLANQIKNWNLSNINKNTKCIHVAIAKINRQKHCPNSSCPAWASSLSLPPTPRCTGQGSY